MISRGDLSQAKTLLKKTLDSFLQEDHTYWWRLKIELLLAWIALSTQLGDHSRAVRLIGAVDSMYQQTKVSYSPRERTEHQENLDACRSALGEEAFQAAFAEGQVLNLRASGWLDRWRDVTRP